VPKFNGRDRKQVTIPRLRLGEERPATNYILRPDNQN
jgi:hypothetical protein